MSILDFIEKLKEILEDTDSHLVTPDCIFKELEEWNSLAALSTIAMIDEEYNIVIKGDEIRTANTIEDLFHTVNSKL